MSSASSSGSDSESSDSDPFAEERRRDQKRRRREAEDEAREARKREKRAKKEKKEKKKKEKKHHSKKDKKKKEKRHKRRDGAGDGAGDAGPRGGPPAVQWGKYGIIKEDQMYEKQEEFLAWLSEVKGVPQEACSQRDLKEHFSTYVEDYNTATLPDEKYYSLRTWYLKEQARKAREGADAQASAAATFERTTFDDEAARKAELARERAKRSEATTALMAKAMRESKGSSALMEDMRQQEEARRLMQVAYKTGDESKAREMALRLDPNHVTEEQMRATWGSGAGPQRKARKPQKS